VTKGREKDPIPFGGPPGPLRLFHVGLGDQAAWMLPFALFGLLAWRCWSSWTIGAGRSSIGSPRERPSAHAAPTVREPAASTQPSPRYDRRLAATIVLGGWFLVEAVVLSLSKGIVHPYYVSALAPGTGAMAGAGVVAFVELARKRGPRRIAGLALTACAVASTIAVQVVLLHREHYLEWFIPPLVVGAPVGVCALLALRRLAAPAVAFAFLLLLVRADRLLGHHVARAGRGHISRRPTQARSSVPAPTASTRAIRGSTGACRLREHARSRHALGTVDRRLRHGVSDDAVRPGSGRAGRLQRHRPISGRSRARAAGEAG